MRAKKPSKKEKVVFDIDLLVDPQNHGFQY